MAMTRWPELPPRRGTKPKNGAKAVRDHDDSHGADDAHIIRRNGAGNFECISCRRVAYSATGARRIAASACGGAISADIHQTHIICTSQGLTWCRACGAYSSRWPRQLLQQCTRRPRSQAQRNVLRRLTAGMMPTTSGYLASVAQSSGRPADTIDNIRAVEQVVVAADAPVSDHGLGRNMDSTAEVHGRHGRPRDLPSHLADPRPSRAGQDSPLGLSNSSREPPRRTAASPAPAPGAHRYFRLDKTPPAAPVSVSPACRPDSVGQQSCGSFSTEPRAASPKPRASSLGDKGVTALSCTVQSGITGSWSGRAAINGAKHPTPCNSCTVLTRIRCRTCRQGLCIQCIKTGRACRQPPLGQSGSEKFESNVSPSSVPILNGPMTGLGSRRRSRAKQPAPLQASRSAGHLATVTSTESFPSLERDPSCQAGGAFHNHEHHRHHHHGQMPPLARPSDPGEFRPASDGDDFNDHSRHHHWHHGESAVTGAASVPRCLPHASVASEGVNFGNYRHHHHHDDPAVSTLGGPLDGHNDLECVEERSSRQYTLQEDWARQHDVVSAPSLTSSVSPLSQGHALSVVVAAGAADLSDGPGPPQQRVKCHIGSATEHSHTSPITSPSAAAAPWYVSRAHP